jgi:methyl-accepting chemotaxis protein
MKPKPFFLAQWWSGLNLQVRLSTVFTVLFVFCALVISMLLFSVVTMISFNSQISEVFERNRQVYRLIALTEQYDVDLNQYEINSSQRAQEEMASMGDRLNEMVAALRLSLPEEDLANLEKYSSYQKQLPPLVEQIVAAVNGEQLNRVQTLDNKVNALMDSMYAEINAISDRGVAELQDVKDLAEIFSWAVYIGAALAILVFLCLYVFASLVAYLQINEPLAELTRAAKDLAAGKFRPAEIEKLAGREDEIGGMARDFLTMASAVGQRATLLQQEADEIRAKIH